MLVVQLLLTEVIEVHADCAWVCRLCGERGQGLTRACATDLGISHLSESHHLCGIWSHRDQPRRPTTNPPPEL